MTCAHGSLRQPQSAVARVAPPAAAPVVVAAAAPQAVA